ncbi:hypothetical protein GGTG_00887 [Gaeumannomyces tritici R3-111a-1]|uniref:Uncharacterized protein n=1 Tax=Gaeumannomyces tritici (strain R3-111a-1) TaxID=644352 RepID=J3NI02_GAET3|nr:hypothetical protein GGTG_00887 [Gaeumannomyces tritici R3-111a-1]EJT80895.1 hypothetical protein GGTG_00887 [Gaeumannomyces tritici R3-111a-1]
MAAVSVAQQKHKGGTKADQGRRQILLAPTHARRRHSSRSASNFGSRLLVGYGTDKIGAAHLAPAHPPVCLVLPVSTIHPLRPIIHPPIQVGAKTLHQRQPTQQIPERAHQRLGLESPTPQFSPTAFRPPSLYPKPG